MDVQEKISASQKDPLPAHMLSTVHSREFGYVAEYHSGIDGIELIPRPTSDTLDPLNFSKWRKWTALSIVMFMYFLFTFLTTTTVPSFPLLRNQYSISIEQVNWTVAVPALGLSVGPLFWSSVADIYGRRIVIIAGTIIAFLATIWSALAPDYAQYMAARFFQGWGVSPAATVGLAVINDLFFEHERGQKIGLWVLAIDTGLLVGPLVGGFVTLISQQWVAWLTAILFGVLLLLEIFLLPETLYPRIYMLSLLPTTINQNVESKSEKLNPPTITPTTAPTTAPTIDLNRTLQLPFFNFRKVPGTKHPKPWDAMLYFFAMWSFPNVAIMVFFYCFAWYWWILSVITYLPTAYAQYTSEIQGLLFIGLILGTLFSEIMCSGTLGDVIMLKTAQKNRGVRVPESRLWLIYPAVLISAIGLIVWGLSIDQGYHWIVGQIAFFLFAAGIQMGNTAVCAYIVDCHPQHGMSVIIFYSVLLNLSAFVNPFFIIPWVDTAGPTWTFSGQAVITFFVMIPVTAVVHRFGAVWREKRGQPSWSSPEYS